MQGKLQINDWSTIPQMNVIVYDLNLYHKEVMISRICKLVT